MIIFRRCIGETVIKLFINTTLYRREQRLLDSILRTYTISSNDYCTEDNEYSYQILEKDSQSVLQCKQYTICDLKDPHWFFILTSNLERFYANILRCTVIHGACIQVKDKSMLLIGKRFSGKTTLTKYLAFEKNGKYLDDDCTYIVNEGFWGFAFPLPMRTAVDPADGEVIVGQTVDEDDNIRTMYCAQQFAEYVPAIDAVIILRHNVEGRNQIRELTKTEAFRWIMKNVRSHYDFKALVTDITNLTLNSSCYFVEYESCEVAYQLIFDCLEAGNKVVNKGYCKCKKK